MKQDTDHDNVTPSPPPPPSTSLLPSSLRVTSIQNSALAVCMKTLSRRGRFSTCQQPTESFVTRAGVSVEDRSPQPIHHRRRRRLDTAAIPDTHHGYMSRKQLQSLKTDNSIRETNGSFDSCDSCKRLRTSLYMSCMSQNFRLLLVSNLSVQNFRICLLIYPGHGWRMPYMAAGWATPTFPSSAHDPGCV